MRKKILQLQVTTHLGSDDHESGKFLRRVKVLEIGRSSWRVGARFSVLTARLRCQEDELPTSPTKEAQINNGCVK